MIIAIPSYKRPQCISVNALKKAGFNMKDVVVGVQTEEDYKAYKEIHGDIEIMLKPASCCAGNRNNLIKELKPPVILMDDDIVSFEYYNGNSYVVDNEKVLNELLELAKTNNKGLMGISSNDSNIIRISRPQIQFNQLLQGSFLVVKTEELFDENYKVIDDYELCCRVIQNKQGTVRYNNYSLRKKLNTKEKGGCHDLYKSGALEKYLKLLELQYPFFKANKKYTGGTINKKWIK